MRVAGRLVEGWPTASNDDASTAAIATECLGPRTIETVSPCYVVQQRAVHCVFDRPLVVRSEDVRPEKQPGTFLVVPDSNGGC